MSEDKSKVSRITKDKEPEVLMNFEAFGISRDNDGKYYLVTVLFDHESGKAKVVDRLLQGDRGEAFQRFKIAVSQSKIMG